MKIVFTKHAEEKFNALAALGWKITKNVVIKTVKKPVWKGMSRFGQETAMNLINKHHILRVIFNKENDIIKIITFHVVRRGKYESTL